MKQYRLTFNNGKVYSKKMKSIDEAKSFGMITAKMQRTKLLKIEEL